MPARLEVVILTGYSSISTAVEAIKLGAVNYLCKPAGVEEIIAAFESRGGKAGEVPLQDSPPSVNRLEWEHIQKVLNQHRWQYFRHGKNTGHAPQNTAAEVTKKAGQELSGLRLVRIFW